MAKQKASESDKPQVKDRAYLILKTSRMTLRTKSFYVDLKANNAQLQNLFNELIALKIFERYENLDIKLFREMTVKDAGGTAPSDTVPEDELIA